MSRSWESSDRISSMTVVHHFRHAAHDVVVGHGDLAGAGVVGVEPAQGQSQQRQGVGTFAGIGDQAIDQSSAMVSGLPASLARAAGPLITTGYSWSGIVLSSLNSAVPMPSRAEWFCIAS